MKGIVIAGTHSGAGKTTITLGIMAALTARGYRVAPFKVGPDFIDPGHHSRITGHTSRNLDGWMLTRETNLAIFSRACADADIAVVEGVMGLFDGIDGRSEAGSTAQMAKWLGLPVMLVVGARSMARSAAALVQGFERFDAGLTFAGTLFNQLGSERHLGYLSEAMAGHVRMPVLGGVLRDESIAIPERHLGLVTREEHELGPAAKERLAALIEERLDLDALVAALPEVALQEATAALAPAADGKGACIGVARDAAFCFYYPENLELLERAGARLRFFSPLTDRRLPDGISGLYLGGGYPELHAEALAANVSLCRQIGELSRANLPIYAECGGLMYLGREVRTLDGKAHSMTGCLPLATRMLDRRKALGYREVTQRRATILGPAGQVMRGHEFHYSAIRETQIAASAYGLCDRTGANRETEGFVQQNTLGSYMHLHFASNPLVAENLVAACGRWADDNESIWSAYET